MRTFLRRLRGLVTTALVWAAVWGLAGALMGLTGGLITGDLLFARGAVIGLTFVLGICGGIGGLVFAIVLMLLEHRSRLEDLSLPLVAVWGALGGMALPVYAIASGGPGWGWWVPMTLFGVLGAGCAAGTLALARRPTAVTVT